MYLFIAGLIAWIAAHVSLFAGLPPSVLAVLSAAGVILSMFGITSQATDPSPLAIWLDNLPGNGLKTIIGVIGAVLAYLLGPDVIGQLSPGLAHALQQIFLVLSSVGLFHKMAKVARSTARGPSLSK